MYRPNNNPTSVPSFQFTAPSPASSSRSASSSSRLSPGSTSSGSHDYQYAHQLSSLQSEHFDSSSTHYPETFTVSVRPTSSSNSSPSGNHHHHHQHHHRSISPSPPSQSRRHAEMSNYNEISQLLQSLRQRRVNTLSGLRRIEKTLLQQPTFSTHYMQSMSEAWTHYVQSHNLLTELRGLTGQYPFSAELLDAAKRRVYEDPSSSGSWNYAWLCLVTMKSGSVPNNGLSTSLRRIIADRGRILGK